MIIIVVLVEIAIVTKIVSDIIERVDSDQTDNPNDKEQ